MVIWTRWCSLCLVSMQYVLLAHRCMVYTHMNTHAHIRACTYTPRGLANHAQCLKLSANIDVRDYSEPGLPFPSSFTVNHYFDPFLYIPPALRVYQPFNCNARGLVDN